MSAATQRRLTRYASALTVNPLTGDQSVYDSLFELEQIIDLLPNGVATLDRKLHFLRINPAFADWLTLTPADIIGRSLIEVMPNRAAWLAPVMAQVIQDGIAVCSTDRSGSDKADERQLAFFPLRDKKSRIQGLILRVDRMRPAESSAVRTEEQRYQHSLAHMQRVSTIGELASSLAHELNQPLAAILSNAQAALRFSAGGAGSLQDVREILNDIVADDKRAGEVISRLRMLLRKNVLEHQDLSVNAVVEDVWRVLRSEAVMRRASIQLELAPELPLVHGDPVQLQQVLLNLMLNGLESMGEEAPARRILVVSTRRISADRIQISVRDAGHGLDKDQPDQVFEPFYTTKQNGLGMGLSIARSIVHSHQGQLSAEANADRGATFHLTLPVQGAA